MKISKTFPNYGSSVEQIPIKFEKFRIDFLELDVKCEVLKEDQINYIVKIIQKGPY